MHTFEDLKVIGEGSFSIVYRATRKIDSKPYAIKKMKLSSLTSSEKHNCLNEIRLLASITHPNIIEYKQAFFEDNHLYLVTQYAEKGDFLKLMMERRKRKSPFTEEEFCIYAREMANGLNGIHRTNILHRDIKAANFFIAGERVKLGDMNVSSISKTGMANTKIGTPYYTSPQIWQELPYSFKSDIWSLGCLFYEMITFVHPFSGRDICELKKSVLSGKFAPLPPDTPEQIANIISSCLQKNPELRPTSDQLLKNAYLKKKYNEFKQKTMQKSMMNDRQHKQACRKILREISCSGTCDVSRTLLPKSKYLSDEKNKNKSCEKNKKGQKNVVKRATARLLTMYSIYHQKPPQPGRKNLKIMEIR